jgi:hypothetical protein
VTKTNLFSALNYDIKKRLSILEGEVKHLIESTRYRSFEGASTASTKENSQSSVMGLMIRLNNAGQSLLKEVQSEKSELAKGEQLKEVLSQITAKRQGLANMFADKEKHPNEKKAEALLFIWNAKMRSKTSMLVERLRDLHDRVEQYVQRANPDHPEPVVRRRSEQGLADKFLNEHVRWVHRDIAQFCKSMGADYPFSEVPTTIQFWNYESTSRQHSFTTYESHKEWCKNRFRPYADAGDNDRIPAGITEMNAQNRFTSVSLSFFLPDRPVYQAFIGHELAHATLRDLYGREQNKVLLERDDSALGKLYRAIHDHIEVWMHLSPYLRSMESQITVELMSDLLAIARYGCAFGYAWLFEAIDLPQIAMFFDDEFTMLENLEFGPDVNEMTLASIWDKNFSSYCARLRTRPMPLYLRTKMISSSLRAIQLETDICGKELCDALDQFADIVLFLFVGDGSVQAAVESSVAEDLRSAVLSTKTGFFETDINKFVGRNIVGSYVNAARSFRESSNERGDLSYLNYQIVSELFKKHAPAVFNDASARKLLSDAIESPNCIVFHTDLLWRFEWLFSRGIPNEKSDNGRKSLVDQQADKVRLFNALLFDEYLFSTSSSLRLLTLFAPQDYSVPANIEENLRNSNKIDEKVIANLIDHSRYGQLALIVLDIVKRLEIDKPGAKMNSYYNGATTLAQMTSSEPKSHDLLVQILDQSGELTSEKFQLNSTRLAATSLFKAEPIWRSSLLNLIETMLFASNFVCRPCVGRGLIV